MRIRRTTKRLLGEESGFTLPEMTVTILMMITVLFALYSIFDMSLRVFSFGNDKIEAVENARLGLEMMEREIRAAYPCDASDESDTNNHLFFNSIDTSCSTTPAMPTPTQITFGNDLSSSIESGYRKVDFPVEVLTYYQDESQLMRLQNGTAEAVAAPVAANGLQFSYLDENGNPYPGADPTPDPSEIHTVRISLTIAVDDATQTLATTVDLRSRG